MREKKSCQMQKTEYVDDTKVVTRIC